jgi:hydrogenase expression/formation protein HypE
MEIGKVSQKFLKEVILSNLGKENPNVIFGPKVGGDVAVVKLNEQQVLIACSDPLSIIPALGMEDSAWLTVHLLASDLTTCGNPPMYALLSYNLPPHMDYEDFKRYWLAIHEEMKNLGVSIIGGHTGKYVGCDFTVVGGGVMFTIAEKDNYVTSRMAEASNLLVLTKGVAISASSILARAFPEKVEKELGSKTQKKLASMFKQFSTVKDALTAAKIGLRSGVTAMHDCTEGGLFGAIYELTEASEVGVEIYKENIILDEDVKAICDLFKIDPYRSLNEGALLICVKKEKVDDLINILKSNGINAFIIGEIKEKEYGKWIIENGKKQRLEYVDVDPYWKAFWDAFKAGWK